MHRRPYFRVLSLLSRQSLDSVPVMDCMKTCFTEDDKVADRVQFNITTSCSCLLAQQCRTSPPPPVDCHAHPQTTAHPIRSTSAGRDARTLPLVAADQADEPSTPMFYCAKQKLRKQMSALQRCQRQSQRWILRLKTPPHHYHHQTPGS